jgi:hypothetical protein
MLWCILEHHSICLLSEEIWVACACNLFLAIVFDRRGHDQGEHEFKSHDRRRTGPPLIFCCPKKSLVSGPRKAHAFITRPKDGRDLFSLGLKGSEMLANRKGEGLQFCITDALLSCVSKMACCHVCLVSGYSGSLDVDIQCLWVRVPW